MRVVIVGGGIGGLSAAIALRRGGHEVVVLERTPRLEPAGAGITLFANAMRGLEELGVAEKVNARGAPARQSRIRTSDGRVLSAMAPDLLIGAVAIHRAELQAVLLEAAGEIRLGMEVSSISQAPDGVSAHLADGSEQGGDLLVGADGLRSVVRASIGDAAPRYGGYTAWRGVSPSSVEPGHLTESWGAGERFGLVDIGPQTYWFATANRPEGETDRPSERKAELLRRFAGWHEPIKGVLEETPAEAILRNDVYFLEPLARWSERRILLLGDAAHATTPGVGQGAAQAIEDAVVLANELGSGEDPTEALGRYESVRRPRAELALKLSRRADAAAQLDGPVATRLRNFLARSMPQSLQRRQLGPLIHRSPYA